MFKPNWAALAAALFCTTLIASCGGGGANEATNSVDSTKISSTVNTNGNATYSGNSDNSIYAPNRMTLSGTVAIGSPLQGADVAIYSMDGRRIIGVQTDENGRYSADVTDYAAPYLILATTTKSNTYPVLKSVSIGAGTANVTPLTELLTEQLYPNAYNFDALSTEFYLQKQLTQDQIATARTKVVSYLLTRPSKYDANTIAPIDVSSIMDFISTPFEAKAGNAYDDALEALTNSLQTNENIFGVSEYMFHKDIAIADVNQLPTFSPTDFIACSLNLCGHTDEYGPWALNIHSPNYPKMSLVKTLLSQYANRSIATDLDCEPTFGIPILPGFQPGINHVTIDGTAIRMKGSPNDFVFPLLSALLSFQ